MFHPTQRQYHRTIYECIFLTSSISFVYLQTRDLLIPYIHFDTSLFATRCRTIEFFVLSWNIHTWTNSATYSYFTYFALARNHNTWTSMKQHPHNRRTRMGVMSTPSLAKQAVPAPRSAVCEWSLCPNPCIHFVLSYPLSKNPSWSLRRHLHRRCMN